jgi:HPt (histidine-containing phosphotransfer) domain-containing protein
VTSAELSRAIGAVLGEPRVQPEGGDGHEAVEVAVLNALVDDLGDASVVMDALDVYLDELPGRLESMNDALAQEQFDVLRDAAHSLKSSSRMLGAATLSDLCRDLEAVTMAQSRTGTSSGGDLTPMVDALHAEAFRVAQWLSELRAGGYPGIAASASSGT